MTPYWFLNVTLFNIFNVIIGAVIGLSFSNWKWLVSLSILLGVSVHFVFDLISYGNPFMHPLAMALDSIGFLAWAFLVYFLKQLISKTQATTRIWIRITVLLGVPVVLFGYWITPNTFALSHSGSADIFKPRLRLLAPGVLSVALGSAARAAGLALQKDGTIVIGGYSGWWPKVLTPSTPNPSRAVVLRLAPNDRLGRPAVTLLADTPSDARGVATGHDGTIAVVGGGSHSVLVARLLPDGVPDPAFGGSGVVLAKMRSSMMPAASGGLAVAIQGDGRIVMTGSAEYVLGPLAQGSYCTTARFTRDGRFDRRFGDKGRVLALVPGNTLCSSTSVLAAPDGKIIVIGTYNSELTDHHIAVFRYLPDGTLDRQFGRDGIAELLKMPAANVGGSALDSQGRIIVIARELLSPSRTRMLIARFDPDGNLDQSFGTNGTVSLHESNFTQMLSAVALQQDGKIVAVGTYGYGDGTLWWKGKRIAGKREHIVVVRLDANGGLDKSFAGGGLLIMASPGYFWSAKGIAIQPDGKLLVAGNIVDKPKGSNSIVIVRLNPDGTPDADFAVGH